ncbi:cytochrome c biogenesis protein ResB [Pseudolysinimonas sp.]|uniref:cytochrome c biogenesis protein ResB n=1 Tax=Pseudolysinimonas sp. TaxID=2680009 RepID=UPI003F7E0882
MSRSDQLDLRPDDHADSPEPERGDRITQPRLGPVGWLRFLWRQLTSMRTALLLLLLLAVAAIPGSLVPQRTSDPNGVIQYQQNHPEAYKILDSLGVFSTFASPWFSAIYLLLFVSLVGCIIPRTRHHLQALVSRPPRTPMRLQRLVGYREASSAADVETAVTAGRTVLRRLGYRVERYGDSVSAERGYLRETGNLIFHVALVGILLTVGVLGSFGYTGQKILVQDGGVFTNVGADYDSFNPGRFASVDDLTPFQMKLDSFTASYSFNQTTGNWDPHDYVTKLRTREPGQSWTQQTLKINSPISIGGTEVYLLGNGYAPVLTIRAPDGTVVKDEPTPFLAQDANLTSTGVIKVVDGLKQQVGIQGFFRPTPNPDATKILSFAPQLSKKADVFLSVYVGDLGLDGGTPQNVYTLNVDKLKLAAGRDAATGDKVGGGPIDLTLGQKAQLPDGLGTIEFSGIKRYVSLDIHHDPTPTLALVFALLVLGGLLLSLFIPRRRVWITAESGPDGTVLRYAGLARGEDANLAGAVAEVAERHRTALGDEPPPGGAADDLAPPENPKPRM